MLRATLKAKEFLVAESSAMRAVVERIDTGEKVSSVSDSGQVIKLAWVNQGHKSPEEGRIDVNVDGISIRLRTEGITSLVAEMRTQMNLGRAA